jgi:hypothetical protein
VSIKDQAFRVAVLGALKDALGSQYADERGDLLEQLVAAQGELGVKSLDVSLPDGTKVATVTLTQPSDRVEVVDEAAFTNWVAEHWPTEVVTVTQVRPAFRKALLDSVAITTLPDGADQVEVLNVVVDVRTGVSVDGVRVRQASKPTSFSVRYTPDGRPAIAEAWREGRLDGYRPLLELEGGE